MGLFGSDAPTDSRLQQLRAEYQRLRVDSNERIERMKTYRAEGENSRDRNLPDSLAGTDYGRQRRQTGTPMRHNIPLPFGKALTVKHAYRTGGQLPDVIVDRRAETPEERYRSDTMEKIVYSILRASQGQTALASGAWDASELGSAVFDLYYDIKKQTPIFRRLDPAGVIEVQGVENPHEFQRVYRSWLVPLASVQAKYRDSVYNGIPTLVSNLDAYCHIGGRAMVQMVEVCDPQSRVTFAFGENQVVGLDEYVHGFGFTPVVIIPNLGPYEDVWGWADYEFVRSLQFYMGQLFSREADVLRTVANGSYVEKGTGQNPDSIKQTLAVGGVIPSKREGAIDPVQPPQMPGFAETHADRAMQFFKMLGFAPDAAWGNPGRVSGTAANLQMQPLLEYTAMKQNNWGAGLSRLFGMAYQMIEQKLAGTATYRGAKPGKVQGSQQHPFAFQLGSDMPPAQQTGEGAGDDGLPDIIELPRTPKELFDEDYEVRFVFQTLIDPKDPSYVASELNKFTSGAQSLQTTLENLGVQAPEDEMRRIEEEADRFPWINQGMVQMILAQIRGNAQGSGGGAQPQQDFGAATDTMAGDGGGQSGALNADAMTGALPDGTGPLYGQA